MTIPRTVGWGIALALGTALISGVSVFANGLIIAEFDDPVALAGARNALVGLALVGGLLVAGRSSRARARARADEPTLERRPDVEPRPTPDVKAWLGLGAIAVIGGSVPFILFFSGLAEAGGPGAAIIHKTMFIWVAALAIPFLGESLGWAQIAAIGALLAGTLLISPTQGLGIGFAEALILAATLLWAVEVVLVRRLLRGSGVGVGQAAAARMALGAVVILGFLAASGRIGAIGAFSLGQWALIGATGLLLLGYVTTWYGALQRAPATLVTSVLVGGAVVTAVLSTVRLGTLPAPAVVGGLALIGVGVAVAAGAALWRVRARRSAAATAWRA